MVKKPVSKKTGPGSEQFQLRLPDGMRKHLAEVAEREGRSMNVVVVTALEMYFETERQRESLIEQLTGGGAKPRDAPPEGYRRSTEIETALKDLRDRLANQDQKLTELIKKTDTSDLVELIKRWRDRPTSWDKAIALKAKK